MANPNDVVKIAASPSAVRFQPARGVGAVTVEQSFIVGMCAAGPLQSYLAGIPLDAALNGRWSDLGGRDMKISINVLPVAVSPDKENDDIYGGSVLVSYEPDFGYPDPHPANVLHLSTIDLSSGEPELFPVFEIRYNPSTVR